MHTKYTFLLLGHDYKLLDVLINGWHFNVLTSTCLLSFTYYIYYVHLFNIQLETLIYFQTWFVSRRSDPRKPRVVSNSADCIMTPSLKLEPSENFAFVLMSERWMHSTSTVSKLARFLSCVYMSKVYLKIYYTFVYYNFINIHVTNLYYVLKV